MLHLTNMWLTLIMIHNKQVLPEHFIRWWSYSFTFFEIISLLKIPLFNRYDEEEEMMTKYQRIFLEDIDKIEIGNYKNYSTEIADCIVCLYCLLQWKCFTCSHVCTIIFHLIWILESKVHNLTTTEIHVQWT